ncbi:MAG: hypothetical protein ACRENI_12245 [Gemmatimonadaceae bacterium]
MSGPPSPFFTAPGRSGDGLRRLLLVSYHFPPGVAVGGLRWRKFAVHLADCGWALDAITLDPRRMARRDEGALHELPPGTRVYGVADPDLAFERMEHQVWKWYRRARPPHSGTIGGRPGGSFPGAARPDSVHRSAVGWNIRDTRALRRAYYAWRDHVRMGRWASEASSLALRLGAFATHEAVISAGPPHMAHEAGRRISEAGDMPLVMDLRDPWSLWQRLPEELASPVWLRLARRYERRCVDRASLILVNTAPARSAMQAAYPAHARRIVTVMNGFDRDPLPTVPPRHAFTIAYVGTIYLDRDPRPLFRACARLIRELGLSPEQFAIELMGDVRSYQYISLESIADEEGVAAFVHLHAPRNRSEALALIAGAAMLVSLPQDSDLAIPSKVFEYMQFDAWVLAIASPGSATALLLADTGADVVAPGDEAALFRVLLNRFSEFTAGTRARALGLSRPSYSRTEQARILLGALASCLDQGEAKDAGSDLARAASEVRERSDPNRSSCAASP